MPSTRSALLNLRISPEIKEALKVAAEKDHRSLANMVEYLIREHCREKGIEIGKLQANG